MKNSSDLIDIFENLFSSSENTLLVGGAEEPLYSPADEQSRFHRIFFRYDYFASALHEIAHWCLAGKERRLIEDYGYWYKPDGRDDLWQSKFEQVEVKPQALESIFSASAGVKFRVSADNLMNPNADNLDFQRKVEEQALIYLKEGLPARADSFNQALLAFYSH